jgi:hypothetical protein
MSSTVAGLPGTVGPPDRAGNTMGPASLQMLDGTNGAARLVFESGGRRHAARLNRWIAIIRLERSAVRAARIVWLLDVRTVRWSAGLPPGALYRGVTGLNAEETPILWFRADDSDGGHDGRRGFTASGVLGAAGIIDAARVHAATRRLRRQIRLRMAVNPHMWGLSACLAGSADLGAEPGPQLTITAAGTLRPLESEAIRTWM